MCFSFSYMVSYRIWMIWIITYTVTLNIGFIFSCLVELLHLGLSLSLAQGLLVTSKR